MGNSGMGKRAYFIRRLIQSVVTLFVIVTVIFFIFRLIPADPTALFIDSQLSPKDIQALRAEWGFDKPLHTQYLKYIRNLMVGDFGRSFFYREPVWGVISGKILNTFVLMGMALVITFVGAIVGGAYLGWHRGKWVEKVGVVLGLSVHSLPIYWIGIMALMVFTYWIRLFPTGGMHTMGYEASGLLGRYFSLDFLKHLCLPMLCAALYYMSDPLVLMRTSMLEVKGEDFLEMSIAKGFSERTVIQHCARNALLPVVSHAAIMSGFLFGGQVLLETVFTWPGMGRELVLAVMNLDYPVAQAAFFLMAVTVVAMNLFVDFLYGYLDPRIVYK
jgi:peptide/nickel transport system permease protein